MKLLEHYIEKQKLDFTTGEYEDFPQINAVVVIPCYNEPDIGLPIRSLSLCKDFHQDIVVVVVVNSSQDTPDNIILQNKTSIEELHSIAQSLPEWLHLKIIETENTVPKLSGVGAARKTGMDWAVRLFFRQQNPKGIIISLDADTSVADNYLSTITKHFTDNPKTIAATIYFEHQTAETAKAAEGITLYELYMRYYKHALQQSGFPHSFYTIGSAFSVRVQNYCAMGGMNKRQAGEDFYFIHKMSTMGIVDEINDTTVYPSARVSNRVPFGTGPKIKEYIDGNNDLLSTYPLNDFLALKPLFDSTERIYNDKNIETVINTQVDSRLRDFVIESKLDSEIAELAKNCGSATIFKKRFFHIFNAFQVLKWLHYTDYCRDKSTSPLMKEKHLLTEESIKLLSTMGFHDFDNSTPSPADILSKFRTVDKGL